MLIDAIRKRLGSAEVGKLNSKFVIPPRFFPSIFSAICQKSFLSSSVAPLKSRPKIIVFKQRLNSSRMQPELRNAWRAS